MKYILFIFTLIIGFFLIGCNSNDNVVKIINLIDELSIQEEITLEHRDKILNIREKLNDLNVKEREKVTNYNQFIVYENEIKLLYEELNIKIEIIGELIKILSNKNILSTSEESLVNYINNLLDQLTDCEKTYIKDLDTFYGISNEIYDIKMSVLEINEFINNIPEDISLDYENQFIEIRAKYENLSNEDKLLINNFDIFEQAEVKLMELKNINELKNGKALDCINDILTSETNDELLKNTKDYTITWSSSNEKLVYFENGFIKVSKVYQTHKQQTVIITATVKFSDETIITSSKEVIVNPINYEDLNVKIEIIGELIKILSNKNILSTSEESLVNYINNLLDQLTDCEKTYIKDLDTFYGISNEIYDIKMSVLEINEFINNIPEDISLDYENQFIEIRAKYENLSNEDKLLINNFDIFEQAEVKLMELKNINELKNGKALDCINDILTSETNDELLKNTKDYTITWSSSNEKLVYFENGFIKVSKVYQTHKQQTVIITATVKFSDDTIITSSKEVIVNPVKYEELPKTPVATYYQSTALSSYTSYSERYLEERTLFSDKAKEVLDIIYFAFGHIDENGNIKLSDEDIIKEINKLKENDVRILVSIAGISTEGSNIFATLTSDEMKLKNFVNNIMDVVEKYNFDGVDVDWESTGEANVLSKGLNNLLKSLREEMDKRQDNNGSNYLLTIAIPARSTDVTPDKFDFKTINKYADYINMMSYELQNNSLTTHGSALYSSSNDNGYGYSVDYAVELFTSYGLDKNKIIIGVSGFGKTYKITETSTNIKYPGLGLTGYKTKLPNAAGAYATGTVFLVAIETAKSTGKFQEYFEYNDNNQLVGSYLYNKTDGLFITYDSVEVIEAKYNYAIANDMGIMCWAYTQDTNDSYVNTIYNLIK